MLEKNDRIRDYTLIKFLGKGQFGEVWLAEKELQFGSRKFRHALKFLSTMEDEIDVRSTEAEIDTWIEASGHPNIIPVLDMFVFERQIIIVSEYADGGSLKKWLADSGGKAPTRDKAIKMMLGILSGIEHLHSRNVVHRDLKPDNILLQGSFPRITDFGISRIVHSDFMHTKVVGSPAYMSPESFDGAKTHQADIWSAGVIFNEMLSGELPFKEQSIYGLANAIRNSAPRPMPDWVPEDLHYVVGTALEKDLEKRFDSARVMRLAIEQVAHDLKARTRNRPSVAEKYPVDPGYVDPAAQTEAIGDDLGHMSIITSTFTVGEDPALPPVDLLGDTQQDLVESTGESAVLGDELQTQTNLGIMQPEPKPLEGSYPGVFGTRRAALFAGVVAAGLLPLIAGFLIFSWYTMSSISVGTEGIATNQSGDVSSPSRSGKTQSAKPPAPPPEMVYVEGGEFMMGRNGGATSDESPAHSVTVKPFLMDKYEVTNEEYAEFVVKTSRNKLPSGWSNNTYPAGKAKFPVVGVDWFDATAYAAWAGKRLPTEEEWEFAARGTDGRIYPWGNTWKSGYSNAQGASGGFTAVGKFKPLPPFGVYDLIGNAWEWTSSDFVKYSNDAGTNKSSPSASKVIRGNSFQATSEYATSTYRLEWEPKSAATYQLVGFRCVRDSN